jgi:hypothetical protein
LVCLAEGFFLLKHGILSLTSKIARNDRPVNP